MPETKVGPVRRRAEDVLPTLLLVASVALVYANAIAGSFQFDDYQWLVYSERVRDLGNLRAILLGGTRPLAFLVNAVNYHFSGESPVGYHVTNIAIHAVQCVLVWQLLRKASWSALPAGTNRRALYDALCLGLAVVYAVHPLNTMAVTYIIQGRMAALAGLFAVACVLSFARFAEAGGWPWASATVAFLLLGVATKENLATLPLVLLSWDVLLVSRGSFKAALRARGVFHGAAFGLIAILGGFFFLRYFGEILEIYAGRVVVRDAGGTVAFITPYTYLLTQFGVVLRYLRLMALPLGQSAEYYWPVATSFFSFRVLGPLAAFLVLGGGAVHFGRKNRLIGFGALWFLLFLLVESSVFPLADVIVEHRAYLPFVGVLLVLVGSAQLALEGRAGTRLQSLPSGPRWVLATLLALAVPYGVAAHARNEAWHSVLTLYEDAYRKYPEHPRVRANLLSAYVNRGRYEEGLSLYADLPEYYRNDDVVRFSAAVAYFSQGRLEVARGLFERVQGSANVDIRERSTGYLRQIALGQAPMGALRAAPRR